VKTKNGGVIKSNLDDSFSATAGKVLPKTTFSTASFKLKHVLDDVDFDQPLTLDRKRFLANKRKVDLPGEHTPSINTYLKRSDASHLMENAELYKSGNILRNGRQMRSDQYITNGKIDYIQTDFITGEVTRGHDFMRFSVLHDKNVINHLNGPISKGSGGR